MAIGVFDSGVGGLTVHHALVRRLPGADFVYLADQAETPYGGKGGEAIVDLTRAGCERLFDEGCDLVILACNTAASVALRRLQQTWLPDYRRAKGRALNVLGIIVPTIEAATGLPWDHPPEPRGDKVERLDVLGVFSTPATTASRVYEIEIDKRRADVAVFSEACPTLARDIENGVPEADLAGDIAGHVAAHGPHQNGAPVRFRHRSRRASLLGGLPAHQYFRSRPLSESRGRRRLLFPLSARQHSARQDAPTLAAANDSLPAAPVEMDSVPILTSTPRWR